MQTPKMNRTMEQLVAQLNRLEDAVKHSGVDPRDIPPLPRIAVVGSQSSGKSSVLEAIVGHEFLPKGSRMVTRCPLYLRLKHVRVPTEPSSFHVPLRDLNSNSAYYGTPNPSRRLDDSNVQPDSARGSKTNPYEPYGEFAHLPGQRFALPDIEREIRRRTEELCPSHKVSKEPIILNLFSPYVPTLSLIDLPGITENAVSGQEAGIVEEIRRVVHDFIVQDETIILAVVDGSTDLANSPALSIAAKVDPTTSRTIGVVTKLDIAEETGGRRTVLLNEEHPLTMGYVGVYNRSLKDVEEKKITLEEARKREQRFFDEVSPYYKDIAADQGMTRLTERLCEILEEHLKRNIPRIEEHIDRQIEKLTADFIPYQNGIPESNQEKQLVMQNQLIQYSEAVRGELEGRTAVAGGRNKAWDALNGGAIIAEIMHKRFWDDVAALQMPSHVNDQYINAVYLNTSGAMVPLYHGDAPLRHVCGENLKQLKRPIDKCLLEVVGVIKEVFYNHLHIIAVEEVRRRVRRMLNDFCDANFTKCKEALTIYQESQRLYVDLTHPLMHETVDSLRRKVQLMQAHSCGSLLIDGNNKLLHEGGPPSVVGGGVVTGGGGVIGGGDASVIGSSLQPMTPRTRGNDELHNNNNHLINRLLPINQANTRDLKDGKIDKRDDKNKNSNSSVNPNVSTGGGAAGTEESEAGTAIGSHITDQIENLNKIQNNKIECFKDHMRRHFEMSKLIFGDQVQKFIFFYLIHSISLQLLPELYAHSDEFLAVFRNPPDFENTKEEIEIKLNNLWEIREALRDN